MTDLELQELRAKIKIKQEVENQKLLESFRKGLQSGKIGNDSRFGAESSYQEFGLCPSMFIKI